MSPARAEPAGASPLGVRPIGVRTTQPLAHAPGGDVAPLPPVDAPPNVARPSGAAVGANELTEHWDDVVDDLRRAGKTLLAAAMQHAAPSAVTALGDVTIQLDEPNEFYAQAFDSGRADLLVAIRSRFPTIERVQLMRDDTAPAEPKKRITEEMIKAERLSALRKRDPVLGAAIDHLDLDPLD